MKVLLDTNILLRSSEPGHSMFQVATDAVSALRSQGHSLFVAPQNYYEFWVAYTRPASANGLGKTAADATVELAHLQTLFNLLDDTPAIYPEWERLVTTLPVVGKNAHDARLVAAMLVHSVTHLLTFNDQDFNRYRGIVVLTPAAVLAPSASP